MKIGLVDIDSHGKNKKWGAVIYPNLALCKISAYHKQIGDEVEWAIPFEHYDKIYISKVFTFTPDDTTIWDADEIERGGTGYDVKKSLPDAIDRARADYSIYPNVPVDYAYGFLTRGCPNKCKFCVVPEKEGGVRPYMDIDEIADERRNKIVLMDNNILSAGDYAKEQLEKIIRKGYRVDFNQALSPRTIDEDFAELLVRVKWLEHRIRFGCDTTRQIAECERAIDLLKSKGFKGEFFLYTMLNSDFKESYERVHYWWEYLHKQKREHTGGYVYAYAQPFRDLTNPTYQPPQWQKDMAQWVDKRMCFCKCDFKDFEPRKGFKCEQWLKLFGVE